MIILERQFYIRDPRDALPQYLLVLNVGAYQKETRRIRDMSGHFGSITFSIVEHSGSANA